MCVCVCIYIYIYIYIYLYIYISKEVGKLEEWATMRNHHAEIQDFESWTTLSTKFHRKLRKSVFHVEEKVSRRAHWAVKEPLTRVLKSAVSSFGVWSKSKSGVIVFRGLRGVRGRGEADLKRERQRGAPSGDVCLQVGRLGDASGPVRAWMWPWASATCGEGRRHFWMRRPGSSWRNKVQRTFWS